MSDETAPELYRRYRPRKLDEVVGQQEAVSALRAFAKRRQVPHAIMFTGPSGCGKTTLARIVAKGLRCSDRDLQEINGADARGIDDIRQIRRFMGLAPVGGHARVWILDECQQITHAAQSSLLKILEDTPTHCYFMLCTTDPQKMLETIRTRCTTIALGDVDDQALESLLRRVLEAEKKELSGAVIEKIIQHSYGSARRALVILNKAFEQKTEDEQLAAVQKGDVRVKAENICQVLTNLKSTWKQVCRVCNQVENSEAEQVRLQLLGYARKILLSGNEKIGGRAFLIIDELREPVFNSGAAGIAAAAWTVFHAEGK